MQPIDEDKIAEFDSFFKDFDLQAALSKQPKDWTEFYTPPDPRLDDNIDSDGEPVLEAWMKPIYDRMMKERAQENASKDMNAPKESKE